MGFTTNERIVSGTINLRNNLAISSALLNDWNDGFSRIVKHGRLVCIESPIDSKFSYGFRRKRKPKIELESTMFESKFVKSNIKASDYIKTFFRSWITT